MGQHTCGCGCSGERQDSMQSHDARNSPTETADADRWLAESPVDATLPDDLQRVLGRFLGVAPVKTLGAFATALGQQAGGSLGVEDLCHADEPTGHRGVTDEATYHFRCFYDAVVLAALVDAPVDIRTETPDGAVVEARAAEGEITATPATAVVSFGIARDVAPPGEDGPRLDAAYRNICPFVRAFPDREQYAAWATTVPAATVGFRLTDAAAFADRLAAGQSGG